MQAGTRPPSDRRPKRLLWFVALYLASLAAFSVLVYGLRLVVPH